MKSFFWKVLIVLLILYDFFSLAFSYHFVSYVSLGLFKQKTWISKFMIQKKKKLLYDSSFDLRRSVVVHLQEGFLKIFCLNLWISWYRIELPRYTHSHVQSFISKEMTSSPLFETSLNLFNSAKIERYVELAFRLLPLFPVLIPIYEFSRWAYVHLYVYVYIYIFMHVCVQTRMEGRWQCATMYAMPLSPCCWFQRRLKWFWREPPTSQSYYWYYY